VSFIALWHTDPLLRNDHETRKEATSIAMQRTARKNCSTVGNCVFYGTLRGYMTRPTEFSSVSECSSSWVEWSEVSWLVSDQLVRGLLQFSTCQLLLLDACRRGTGIIREPRLRGSSAVESRYQTTTGEDTADWRDLVRAVWIVDCVNQL
jgi:hypothetical protein